MCSTCPLWFANIVQEEASACCCTWTKDPVTGAPYLCIGGVDAKVKIYDVVNGKLYRVSSIPRKCCAMAVADSCLVLVPYRPRRCSFIYSNLSRFDTETYLKQDVNDLATSPADPSIIASASGDTSIRVWSIDPVHANRPCLVILAGEGHSWDLLSLVGFSLDFNVYFLNADNCR
jgi:polycomb protein EED